MNINNIIYLLQKDIKRERKINNRLFFYNIILLMMITVYLLIKTLPIKNNLYQIKDNNIRLTNEELLNIIQYGIDSNEIGTNNNLNIEILDEMYTPISFNFIENFLYSNSYYKYQKNKNDCDDFAFITYGRFLEEKNKISNIQNSSFVFGIMYVSNNLDNTNHILNWFMNENYKFYCLEPQEYKINLCNKFLNYKIEKILF